MSIIVLTTGCNGCIDLDPGVDNYDSPCVDPQTRYNGDVMFPPDFYQSLNGCISLVDNDFETLINNQTPAEDVYTSNSFNTLSTSKYYIRILINGRCSNGEPFEEFFEYDQLEFPFANVNRFYLPEFEEGEGTLTFRLDIITPCFNTAPFACSLCNPSATSFQESYTATKEEVITAGMNPIIWFEWEDFQYNGVANCGC